MMKLKRKTAADRYYQVAMAALAEENRVCKLDRETLRQRQKDIWQIAYGDARDR